MFRRSATSPPQPAAAWGRVELLGLTQLSGTDWRALHALYRDLELSRLNAAEPTRIPRWLFRIILLAEQGRERMSFGVMIGGQLAGNAELYAFSPAWPAAPVRATLGVMLAPGYWGRGYGQDTLNALLAWEFGEAAGSSLEPPLERIRLTTLGSNKRAQTAFARAGFEEKGRFQQRGHTEVNMELRREDWLARHRQPPFSPSSPSGGPV
ncbi:GNAT family N-acetyltransferase [Deinococcus sp. Marseille-Q6407]|uniref:GNAT family N-acetyltransferase n=1 Tax=Deinococcus sp. Marseille-Q6407 TaxID=2969223 RepID=UPI0021C0CCC7|nr:GNAT family protein [Deinococcus sp. Marseille-Q6407]